MKMKPGRLALSGMALICAAIFVACNCAPTLRYLVVAPNNGTIYVSAPTGGAIRGARRAARTPVHTSRRAAVKPQDITTAVCGTLQFAATAYYSNGTTQDQSSAATWSSSDTNVASIDNTGFASGVGLGFTNIGATFSTATATTVPLEVDQLNSITVNPPTANIPSGGSQAFTATGEFTLAAGNDTTQDITSQVFWSSTNPDVATVDGSGNITTVGQGSTTITATSCDEIISGSATLTVGPPTSVSLQLSPAASTAAVGTTVQFAAVELFSDGTTQPLPGNAVLAWTSDTTGVASIDGTTGLAQALTTGSANISATVQSPANVAGLTGSTSLTVQAASARFAYVANPNGAEGTGSISSYLVDVTSSTPLTPNTNDPSNPSGLVPLPANPQQVVLHPSGDLLYYIDSNGAVHSFYVSSATGVFASTPTGQGPTSATDNSDGDLYTAVIDPTGRFLYVITTGTSVVYGFTITHTQPSGGTNDGKLTAIPSVVEYTDGTLNAPTWLLTDQTGNFLYIVNNGGSSISEFSISQAAGSLGQLTPLGNSPVNTGAYPVIGRIDGNGHLYVANEGDGGANAPSVSAYTITASGASAGQLTQIGSGPTPIAGATDPISVIASPNSKYLYVLDDEFDETVGQVTPYGLTQPSGVVSTSAIGSAQETGNGPFGGMAIDPTGVLLAIDNATDGTISLYTIGSDGTLTPTSPATVAAGGSGANTEYVVFYTAASGQ